MRQSKYPILGTEPKHIAGSPVRPFSGAQLGAEVPHAPLSSPGTRYEDLGADYCECQRELARRGHQVGKLGALGYMEAVRRLYRDGPPVRGGTGRRDDPVGMLIVAGRQVFNVGGMPGAMPP
jgi:hypothetical protein